jgi:hypothetical protein
MYILCGMQLPEEAFYGEDLHDGRKWGSLTIHNPFRDPAPDRSK